MLKNSLIFAASGLVLALMAPLLLGSLNEQSSTPPRTVAPQAQVEVAAPRLAAAEAPSDGFREKTIPADRGGQYQVDALIDGVSVRMLVDTGATMVSISADLASRIGATPEAGKPKWRIHTANGDSIASPVMLKNVDLGSIYMNDVEALVMERSAGDVNLLGASFLKRLGSVEQRNGMLVLRQ
jgi:aspartyl protease family protein